MTYNTDLTPKHMYRNMAIAPTPRIRYEDVPEIDDFNWYNGQETRSVWCEDKKTREVLFIVTPPDTMRKALLVGYMAGLAAGYREHHNYGTERIHDLFAEDVAHYQLYGFYPDEEFVSDPDIAAPPEMDDLPEQDVDQTMPKSGQRGRTPAGEAMATS